MTTPTTNEPIDGAATPPVEPKADEGTNFTDAINAIEKTVSEKLDKGMAAIEQKITTPAPPKEEDPPYWGESDEDDDDKPVTRKELQSMLSKSKKDNDASNEARSRKQMRDAQAMKDFPELHPDNANFSKKMHDEVSRELNARVNSGRSSDDVDLVYDCAASVASRGVREGWYNPVAHVQRQNVQRNARDDSFSVRDSGGTGSSEPTEEQVAFGVRAGLSKERLTQLLEKTQKK